MVSIQIEIQFDDLLNLVDQLTEEQKRLLQERMMASEHSTQPPGILKKRVAGLGEGTIWISDDFDDPLPDEFWLGEYRV